MKDINFITSKYNLKRIRKIKILIVQGMKLLLQWQEKSFSLYLENMEFSFIQVCTVHQMSLMSIVHMFTLYIKFHNKFSRFQIYKITHISTITITYLEVYEYIQLEPMRITLSLFSNEYLIISFHLLSYTASKIHNIKMQ